MKRIFRFYIGYDPKVTVDADILVLDAVEYFLDTLVKEMERACRESGRMLITVNHLQAALLNMGSPALSSRVDGMKGDGRAGAGGPRAQHRRFVVSLSADAPAPPGKREPPAGDAPPCPPCPPPDDIQTFESLMSGLL